ncbi:MAG: hypothetical protein IT233_09800 [Bacteroidia bacterium]|nr:hypothetical protein [Bacteroidia bacterium]
MKSLHLLLLSLLFTGGGMLAQTAKKGGPLDGKIYIIEIFLDGKEKKWHDDDLKFMAGSKLKSVLFADWNFSANLYEGTVIDSTSEKKVIVFSCETKKNDKGEIMIWSGTVTGKEIEGTIELQNSSGKTKKSFTFTGSEKEKKQVKK